LFQPSLYINLFVTDLQVRRCSGPS